MGHDFCGALLGVLLHMGGSDDGALDAASTGIGPGPRAFLQTTVRESMAKENAAEASSDSTPVPSTTKKATESKTTADDRDKSPYL